MTTQTMQIAILKTLTMALDAEDGTDWFTGLHPTLQGLSAETLSASPGTGRSSIGAHLRHIAYSLQATNAWMAGEKPELNWEAAWQQPHVTSDEVQALLETINAERQTLEARIQDPAGLEPRALTGALKSLVHLGYHVGAIRQIQLQVRP